jgi:hypothetical protein
MINLGDYPSFVSANFKEENKNSATNCADFFNQSGKIREIRGKMYLPCGFE